MIRDREATILDRARIPRESGDDPFVGLAGLAGQLYSPRERG